MGKFNLKKIQSLLKQLNIEGWLLYDFRASNTLALDILDVPPTSHLTRRFFYFIPADGEPTKIVMGIEAMNLDHLPGKRLVYSDHQSFIHNLQETLKSYSKVAMEYSPLNAIPYVSKVDAGTLELIRSLFPNLDIISSGDLISMFSAVWSIEQYEKNIPVAKELNTIVKSAYNFIKTEILADRKLTEYDVQQFIMNEFDKRNYYTDFPPIVSVNENSANPHYGPSETEFKEIKKGDFVLIDLWAKPNNPNAVFSDITWDGYVGEVVPEKFTKIFKIVNDSREAAFNLIKQRYAEGKEVRGFEADDAARKVIIEAGYGDYFIHRTGHSIYTEVHGSGAHLDDYETKDERLLLPNTSFSIEPGIYLTGDFGVRCEYDVFIKDNGEVIVTQGEYQKEVLPILK